MDCFLCLIGSEAHPHILAKQVFLQTGTNLISLAYQILDNAKATYGADLCEFCEVWAYNPDRMTRMFTVF